MARCRGDQPGYAAAVIADDAAVSSRKAKKKWLEVTDKAFDKHLDEVTAMLAEAKFDGAGGRHFVALYAELHFRVYGVAPGDLGKKERAVAAGIAQGMLKREFGGKAGAMAEFVAWTWSREKKREERRRRDPAASGGRIGWRFQFANALLTDFRVEKARRHSPA